LGERTLVVSGPQLKAAADSAGACMGQVLVSGTAGQEPGLPLGIGRRLPVLAGLEADTRAGRLARGDWRRHMRQGAVAGMR